MIELKNWRVLMEVRDRELGYESDHLHRRLEIAVDLDAGWAVKLDMALGKAKNVVDLERTGDVLWVELTRDILASDGLYRCQLRGHKGDTVAHSNQFELLVSGSINAVEAFPSVEPSELAQMEARVTQAKADALRRASSQFCDEALRRTEEAISAALGSVQQAHAAFQNVAGSTAAPAAAPAARQPEIRFEGEEAPEEEAN